MVQNSQDNGRMIGKMEKEWKLGLTERLSKGITCLEKRMDLESYNLQILRAMRDSSKTMKLKELENMYGQIKGSILENGNRVKCMVMEKLFGKMEELTKDSI